MSENEPHAFIVAPPPSRPKTGPPVLRAARVDEAAAVNQGEVSPDKAKLHYQSYHDYYYSITPRDPRLEVPLKPIWPDPTPTSPLTPCTTAARPQEPEIAELTRDGGPSRLTHTPPPPPAADTVTAKPAEKPAVESPIPAQPRIAAAPRASPAERPLSRQGNTHQPYATTPVTPDFLPMGLLDRSPALASLSLPTNETQYDAYADAHRQAAQHSIFGAPSMYYPSSVQPAAMMMMMPQDAAAGYQRPLQAQPIASLPLGTGQAPPGGFNVYRGRGAARGGRGGSGTSHNTPPSPAQSAAKSAMLQQFHENPRAALSLSELTGHIVEFSVDQDGSRLIQRLMVDDATADVVYREVVASVVNLIVDVFGNYVIQRLFECGNEKHHGGLIQAMRGSILPLSLQTYGCRVVQKALQFASHDDQRAIAAELIGHVADCVRDQNGNHVIQKCIEVMPTEAQFIAEAFRGQLPGLASHAYGCRVMQRLFERCPNTDPALEAVVNETLTFTSQLVNDQYGNYVIQHIIINGTHQWRQNVLMLLLSSFSKLSCSKFSSNVTEKLFLHSDEAQRRIIIEAILNERDAQGRCSLVFMMQDQFANYVVQRLLDLSPQPLRERMVEAIMPFLQEIKRFTYGKHIVARLEKMGLLPRSQQGGGFHYHQPQGHQGQAAQNLSPGMAFQQAPAFPQAAPVFAQAFQQQAVYSPSAAYQLLPAGGQFGSAPSVSVNFAGMQPQRIVQPVAPIAEPFQHVPSPQYATERPSPIDGPLEMSHRRQPNQHAPNSNASAQNQRFTQSSTAFSSQNAKHVNPSSLHQLDPAVASAFPAQSPQAVWSG